MKYLFVFIIIIAVIAACNQSGSKNTTSDTLGFKATDTLRRGDTMYYERLQHKTTAGPTDSAGQQPVRNDTMYYERLQHKTTPDTTRTPQ